jgi:hypothetical protein
MDFLWLKPRRADLGSVLAVRPGARSGALAVERKAGAGKRWIAFTRLPDVDLPLTAPIPGSSVGPVDLEVRRWPLPGAAPERKTVRLDESGTPTGLKLFVAEAGPDGVVFRPAVPLAWPAGMARTREAMLAEGSPVREALAPLGPDWPGLFVAASPWRDDGDTRFVFPAIDLLPDPTLRLDVAVERDSGSGGGVVPAETVVLEDRNGLGAFVLDLVKVVHLGRQAVPGGVFQPGSMVPEGIFGPLPGGPVKRLAMQPRIPGEASIRSEVFVVVRGDLVLVVGSHADLTVGKVTRRIDGAMVAVYEAVPTTGVAGVFLAIRFAGRDIEVIERPADDEKVRATLATLAVDLAAGATPAGLLRLAGRFPAGTDARRLLDALAVGTRSETPLSAFSPLLAALLLARFRALSERLGLEDLAEDLATDGASPALRMGRLLSPAAEYRGRTFGLPALRSADDDAARQVLEGLPPRPLPSALLDRLDEEARLGLALLALDDNRTLAGTLLNAGVSLDPATALAEGLPEAVARVARCFGRIDSMADAAVLLDVILKPSAGVADVLGRADWIDAQRLVPDEEAARALRSLAADADELAGRLRSDGLPVAATWPAFETLAEEARKTGPARDRAEAEIRDALAARGEPAFANALRRELGALAGRRDKTALTLAMLVGIIRPWRARLTLAEFRRVLSAAMVDDSFRRVVDGALDQPQPDRAFTIPADDPDFSGGAEALRRAGVLDPIILGGQAMRNRIRGHWADAGNTPHPQGLESAAARAVVLVLERLLGEGEDQLPAQLGKLLQDIESACNNSALANDRGLVLQGLAGEAREALSWIARLNRTLGGLTSLRDRLGDQQDTVADAATLLDRARREPELAQPASS